MEIAYPLSGFAVGALAGLTGMGGGSVMTPLLILVFGVEPAAAVGTDLLFAAATKATGANVHAYRGNVEWRVVGLLAAGSMPQRSRWCGSSAACRRTVPRWNTPLPPASALRC